MLVSAVVDRSAPYCYTWRNRISREDHWHLGLEKVSFSLGVTKHRWLDRVTKPHLHEQSNRKDCPMLNPIPSNRSSFRRSLPWMWHEPLCTDTPPFGRRVCLHPKPWLGGYQPQRRGVTSLQSPLRGCCRSPAAKAGEKKKTQNPDLHRLHASAPNPHRRELQGFRGRFISHHLSQICC